MTGLKSIIITEKPSVAREFAQALQIKSNGKGFFEGNDYIITWAIGHLLTPMDPGDYQTRWKKWNLSSLPIIPEKMEYKAINKVKSQLSIIKKLLNRKDVQEIIVATDAGREGELIARTILGYAKVKIPGKRFWTSEALTKEIILKHLKLAMPLKEYDRLFIAGKARQFADWLVGMNCSRLATLKLGELYSIGRVQTAVLALLVDRRKEIDNFISTPYWNVSIKAKVNSSIIELLWFDYKKSDNATVISDKLLAEKIFNGIKICNRGIVDSFVEKEKIEYTPNLFSLTELQREANKIYKFPASKTLKLAQNLYEKHKCLSYPRTDSKYMGVSSVPLVKSIYQKLKDEYPKEFQVIVTSNIRSSNRRIFDDSKLTDHHALIPLSKYRGDSADEKKIFDLVIRQFAMALSSNHKFLEQKIVVKFDSYYLKGHGKQILERGWKQLLNDSKENVLSKLSKGDVCNFVSGMIVDKKTIPPSEYNEASLLKDMVNPARLVDDIDHKKIFRGQVGLGTQATRAQIIETLIKREYLKRVKNALIAQKKGVYLIETLRCYDFLRVLTSPSETAKWELDLDAISRGEGNGLDFINRIKYFITGCLRTWK